MAATTYDFLIRQVRNLLREPKPKFWQDDELVDWMVLGGQDLWGELIDTHQEHFFTVDATNVSLAANAASLTGVPVDCFRVLLIAPRDTTSAGSYRGCLFLPRDYNSDEFRNAMADDAADPSGSGLVIYYAMGGIGSPISAPTIYTAPQVTTAIPLRLAYIPTLAATNSESSDPIPAESNTALIAWTVAWAKAKDSPDNLPDPGWLAIYNTAKEKLRTRATPRQEQEPEVVLGMFDGL
jgi:hypothetical protein